MKQVEINETVKVGHVQPQTDYRFPTMIGKPVTGWKLFVKRIFDLTVGLIGTVLSSPIVLVFAILVKLTSKGPAFYKQERVGLMGKSFNVIKLRSMYQDAEARTGAVWAQKNDPRITPIGRFMRKTRVDELPQFWNVLKGDMSLVGPRPERPVLTEEFSRQFSDFLNGYVLFLVLQGMHKLMVATILRQMRNVSWIITILNIFRFGSILRCY